MIDLSQLSQEQQWGLSYACLQANKPLIAENEQITNGNNSLPEGEEHKPLKELFTDQSYIENVIKMACDSYYKQLVEEKKRNALAMFDALSPTEQAALVAQLGIPDVLPRPIQ
jgi:hypothetical protein